MKPEKYSKSSGFMELYFFKFFFKFLWIFPLSVSKQSRTEVW